ncbi:hypothetical protein TRVA0_018S02432 [Trichomonascus vanleenenianus]|uniref:Slz1p n=1 Tax=Trichomonascus vanleenenianus TaxID=2268995 RepID=UPI003EC9C3F7
MIREIIYYTPIVAASIYLFYLWSPRNTTQPQQENPPVEDGVPIEVEEGIDGIEDFEHAEPEEGEEEPTNGGAEVRQRKKNKIVGKKKAKSLEKRDQIRAYNEFVRQQAEERKRAQQEFEEAHKEQIEREKQMRALRETQAQENLRLRQQYKKELERKERLEELTLTERIRQQVETAGSVKLNTDTEREIAVKLGLTVINGGSWAVQITRDTHITAISNALRSHNGEITYRDLAAVLSQH